VTPSRIASGRGTSECGSSSPTRSIKRDAFPARDRCRQKTDSIVQIQFFRQLESRVIGPASAGGGITHQPRSRRPFTVRRNRPASSAPEKRDALLRVSSEQNLRLGSAANSGKRRTVCSPSSRRTTCHLKVMVGASAFRCPKQHRASSPRRGMSTDNDNPRQKIFDRCQRPFCFRAMVLAW